MPTSQPRINVVLDRPTYNAVRDLARLSGVSLSRQARDLMVEAVELIEDVGLAAIAEERAKVKRPLLTHQQLKKKLGMK